MPWSDCQLRMLVTGDGDSCKLKFIQPPTNEVLADIITSREQLRSRLDITGRPNAMYRLIFWIASGLRGFTPCMTIESHTQPKGLARFYRCIDRKGRNRIFAEVMHQGIHEGAVFIVNDEDYSIIESQLQNIKNQGESDPRD